MYQRLGNLYTSQRLGSFEGDGTGFAGMRRRRRCRDLERLTDEQLADRLTRKEAMIVQLQQRIAAGNAGKNAAARLARMQERAARIREKLASRKNVNVMNGLGSLPGGCDPKMLAVIAAVGAGAYWFIVRPKLAGRRKR